MNTEPTISTEEKVKLAQESLQQTLALVDFLSKPTSGSSGMELIVIRRHPLLLKIDNAMRHGRPHFHIEYKKGEFSASYAIETCTKIIGNMPLKYERPLLEWANENKVLLYEKWQETHPTFKIYAIELTGS